MKLLLSGLLLTSLCALSSWSVSPPGSPAVTQSPDVSVLEGEAVSITCCWTLEFERIQVRWLKNQTEIKKEIFNLKNVSRGSLLNETSGCSHLNFTNVRREDSGRYICNVTVDIPALVKDAGNGTVIKVTANNTAGESSALQTPVIASLAVVASLLLIALVCFCCLRRRQARAARVIYEVPHIDSEEVDVDKHSTSSSTGSSQWCQVPVYESCDYFERVETKESG